MKQYGALMHRKKENAVLEKKTLSQYHFVHHKSHTNSAEFFKQHSVLS